MSEPVWVSLGAAQPADTPAGVVSGFGGATVPTGYLLCDGAAVSRTTYAALFTAIGTVYGAGDGSTTFNVPDLQGRVPVGKGSHAAVDALGDNDGSALANRQPAHRHTVTDPGHAHTTPSRNEVGFSQVITRQANVGGTLTNISTSTVGTGISIAAAGASAPLDTPAFLTVNYIIKT